MKIVSKDILHKTEAGGVKLTLRREDTMRKAFREIIEGARAYTADAEIEGVLVVPMARKGVEVIIGVSHDSIFGPVMMFGLGGVFVEILQDVVFRAIPLTRADGFEMLDAIKAKKILEGVRGAKPVDREALVDLLMKISALVQAHPEITEIDLNPVFAHDDGYTVVDARMILEST
jgi:acetyltransferase